MNNYFIWWQGVVEDIDDPLKLGRMRVRVLGYHSSNKVDVPTKLLPWAVPIMPCNSASMNGIGASPTGIVPGTWVIGFFRDGPSAQDPIIFGSIGGIPIEKPNTSKGFNDPEGIYPKQDFLNEPDVNRLARNEKIDETVVKLKKMDVETDVTAALNKETWSEPETPYDASYPKNKVIETESGHIIELDDTTGKERIHEYHKSGTFREIHPDGSEVKKIKSKKYEIISDDERILIKGTKTENIEKSLNLKIDEDMNVQISGNVNIYIKGNVALQTDGDFFHKVKGKYAVLSEGNMVFLAPRIDLNPNGVESTDVSIGDFEGL